MKSGLSNFSLVSRAFLALGVVCLASCDSDGSTGTTDSSTSSSSSTSSTSNDPSTSSTSSDTSTGSPTSSTDDDSGEVETAGSGSTTGTEETGSSSSTTGTPDPEYGFCAPPACTETADCCVSFGLPEGLCALSGLRCEDQECGFEDPCAVDQDCVAQELGDTCRNEFGNMTCRTACETDEECQAVNPNQDCFDDVCQTRARPCQDDAACEDIGLTCDLAEQRCVVCVTDEDCSNNASGTSCVPEVAPFYNICRCDGDDSCPIEGWACGGLAPL